MTTYKHAFKSAATLLAAVPLVIGGTHAAQAATTAPAPCATGSAGYNSLLGSVSATVHALNQPVSLDLQPHALARQLTAAAAACTGAQPGSTVFKNLLTVVGQAAHELGKSHADVAKNLQRSTWALRLSAAAAACVTGTPSPSPSATPSLSPRPSPSPSATPTPSPSSSPTPVPSPSPGTIGFRGIFQFTGIPQVNNPAVVGGVLLFNWADLEPQDGVFNWSSVDAGMQVWTSHGKQVAIRVMTVHPQSGKNVATPAWLPAAGAPLINDGTNTLPVYWSPVYLNKLQAFMTAFASRYDGNPNIAWFQGGVGIYGETKVDRQSPAALAAWKKIGYTDVRWFDTVKQIVNIYHHTMRLTPVAISVDSSFIGGTSGYSEKTVVDWLASVGVWPQNDGLRRTSVTKYPSWLAVPSLQEQYLSASAMGDTLLTDLQTILAVHGTYALIYGSDLANPANQSAMNWATAQIVR